MIAPQRFAEPERPRRTAVSPPARRRARRTRRRMHRPALGAIGLAVVLLMPLLLYVMLTARVTALSYQLDRERETRTALLDQTQRLDDRIARLTSPDRLSTLATALGMHDPHVYAVVALPRAAPKPAPGGFAFLGFFRPQ